MYRPWLTARSIRLPKLLLCQSVLVLTPGFHIGNLIASCISFSDTSIDQRHIEVYLQSPLATTPFVFATG